MKPTRKEYKYYEVCDLLARVHFGDITITEASYQRLVTYEKRLKKELRAKILKV